MTNLKRPENQGVSSWIVNHQESAYNLKESSRPPRYEYAQGNKEHHTRPQANAAGEEVARAL